jgi:hypothetical protein
MTGRSTAEARHERDAPETSSFECLSVWGVYAGATQAIRDTPLLACCHCRQTSGDVLINEPH